MTQKRVCFVVYIVLLLLCVFALGYLAGERNTSAQIELLVSEPMAVQPRASAVQPQKEAEGLIDINIADSLLLQTLPGIGPELADRIVAYREQVGGFVAVEQIKDVPGIGEKRYESLKSLITVGGVQ